ncbi:MAG: hypothetical protein ACRDVM_01545 [Acidimicrobiia bacterium]
MQHVATAWLLVTAFMSVLPPAPLTQPQRVGDGLATFEGELVDLSEGWGEATACLVYPGGVECFRTRGQLARRELQLFGDVGDPEVEASGDENALLATCSSPLRLYDGTYQTGDTVSVWTRSAWINLSGIGFDNRTSSFRVGACAVDLASGTWGGGSLYPRCTYAGCEEDVMASGWNNVISSVYLT